MRSDRRWCLRTSRPSCWQACGTRITRPSACGGRATSLALFMRGGEGNPHELLLANVLQSSSRAFSCVSFPSFFAFQESTWDAPISALLNSPTVSARILAMAHGVLIWDAQLYENLLQILSTTTLAERGIWTASVSTPCINQCRASRWLGRYWTEGFRQIVMDGSAHAIWRKCP